MLKRTNFWVIDIHLCIQKNEWLNGISECEWMDCADHITIITATKYNIEWIGNIYTIHIMAHRWSTNNKTKNKLFRDLFHPYGKCHICLQCKHLQHWISPWKRMFVDCFGLILTKLSANHGICILISDNWKLFSLASSKSSKFRCAKHNNLLSKIEKYLNLNHGLLLIADTVRSIWCFQILCAIFYHEGDSTEKNWDGGGHRALCTQISLLCMVSGRSCFCVRFNGCQQIGAAGEPRIYLMFCLFQTIVQIIKSLTY